MAGATSCSCVANVAARRAFSTLGTFLTVSGSSGTAGARGLLISQRSAIGGIVRRVASKNCAPDSDGALTVPCLSSREACTSGRSNESWACLPTTTLFEDRVRATFGKAGQNSTAFICGSNVETGLGNMVDGRSAHRQLGCCVNRLAGHDSEKPAGESGARMARGIAGGVCLTHRPPS